MIRFIESLDNKTKLVLQELQTNITTLQLEVQSLRQHSILADGQIKELQTKVEDLEYGDMFVIPDNFADFIGKEHGYKLLRKLLSRDIYEPIDAYIAANIEVEIVEIVNHEIRGGKETVGFVKLDQTLAALINRTLGERMMITQVHNYAYIIVFATKCVKISLEKIKRLNTKK